MTIQNIPFYVEMGRDVLLAWCHLPEQPVDHAVLICPPVGHEFINSYRGLRHLADGFARKGIVAFRMEYQGVGDSSGLDTDPDRIQKWLASIERVYKFIKDTCGVKRISLVGLRMGATLATLVSNRLEIEALCLWEPVTEGRRYIREMLALQRTGENADQDVDSTSLEGGGFVITRETMNDILALSMPQITPTARHIFLFSSDDMPTPGSLIEEWSSRKIIFLHSTLPGYADMMALPHHSKVPSKAIEQISETVIRANIPAIHISCDSFMRLKDHQQARFDCYTYGLSAKESMDAGGGFPVSETLCHIPNTPLFGILSLPLLRDAEHKPTVLLLNSGSVHRVGPNRNYIYIVRQLLSQGISVMRLDLLGLGDSLHPDPSLENNPYMPEALDNVRDAIAFLKEHHRVNNIILMGVCSGAYTSFQFALHSHEETLHAIMPINPLTFYWREGMSLDVAPSNTYFEWNQYQESMRRKDKWMKVLRGEKNIPELAATVISVVKIKSKAFVEPILNQTRRLLGEKNIEDLSHDLEQVIRHGRQVRFIFAVGDPGYQLLLDGARKTVTKLQDKKSLHLEFIPKANHNFSSHLGRTQLLKKLNDHFSESY
ncbi:MAG TPA: alpha/beta hydrolase [Anaerolineales bacterium]|nr:alpha/beta hydrolase [Anaerolineales bacterium]HNA89441.1 alpha/beta hydrolase [Anaerolineales bacterium]HNC07920.1 alpha/beta hydrolase [Anaerolineales bacterium]